MILSPDEITELVAHMRRTGIAEIEIAEGCAALRVAVPQEVAAAQPVAVGPTIMTATACGIFLPGPPVRAALSIGSLVAAGEIVAFIAAGPLLQPVVAPCAGTLLRLLCASGQRVDYGTELLALASLMPSQSQRQRKDV